MHAVVACDSGKGQRLRKPSTGTEANNSVRHLIDLAFCVYSCILLSRPSPPKKTKKERKKTDFIHSAGEVSGSVDDRTASARLLQIEQVSTTTTTNFVYSIHQANTHSSHGGTHKLLLQHNLSLSFFYSFYFPPPLFISISPKPSHMDYFSLPIGPYKNLPATYLVTQTPQPTKLDVDLPDLEKCPRHPTPPSSPLPILTPTSTLDTILLPYFPLGLPSPRSAPPSQSAPPHPSSSPPPTRSRSLKSAMLAKFKSWKKNMHRIWKR